jgi:hypothetical protein
MVRLVLPLEIAAGPPRRRLLWKWIAVIAVSAFFAFMAWM